MKTADTESEKIRKLRELNEEYIEFLKSKHFKSKHFKDRVIFLKYNRYNRFYKYLVIKRHVLEPLEAERKGSNKKLKILDIGGSGSLTFGALHNKKLDFTLCDSSRENLKNASGHGLKTVYYQGTRLPFASNSFDAVICRNTLEYVSEEEREKICRELIRISKGYVFLIFSNNRHFQWLEKRFIRMLQEVGLDLPYPRGLLPVIDLSQIKPLFRGAKEIKYGNTFLWYLLLYLRVKNPFRLYRIISRYNKRIKRLHRRWPHHEIALVYNKRNCSSQ